MLLSMIRGTQIAAHQECTNIIGISAHVHILSLSHSLTQSLSLSLSLFHVYVCVCVCCAQQPVQASQHGWKEELCFRRMLVSRACAQHT